MVTSHPSKFVFVSSSGLTLVHPDIVTRVPHVTRQTQSLILVSRETSGVYSN